MRAHHSTDRWVRTEIPVDAHELVAHIDSQPQLSQEEDSPVEVQEAMADAIATLTADEWSIFEQHFIWGVPFRTIAFEMEIPKTRAWEIAQTAKAKLAKHLMTETVVTGRYALEPTWNDACRAALMELAPTGSEAPLVELLTLYWEWLKADAADDADPLLTLQCIGLCATNSLSDSGQWSIDDMERLLCSKQHDYGCQNILAFGMIGIAIRMSDKLARYFNLQGREAANESLKDTLMDLVGYAVIAIMLDSGTFERPLQWPIDKD